MRRLPNDFSGPAPNAAPVTPNDSTEISRTRGVYVGVTGDLTVDMWGEGDGVTFVAVPAGSLLPLCVTKIYATGTDADEIVALF